MKCLRWLPLVLALIALPGLGQAEVIGHTDAEVRSAAAPILENLMAGFNEGNYRTYSRDFDDNLKEGLSEKKFLDVRTKILNSLGKYQSGHYLGFLRKGQQTITLWRGTFDKSPDDVLIRLVLSKRQNRILVTGLWFQ